MDLYDKDCTIIFGKRVGVEKNPSHESRGLIRQLI